MADNYCHIFKGYFFSRIDIEVLEMSSDNISTEDNEDVNFEYFPGGSSLALWKATLLPSCMSQFFPISVSAEKRLLSFSLCNCKTQPNNRPLQCIG